ncbi:Fpg/Nei family DNA glycosylase [Georgenia sp. TF02-10]|uniref:DNA-formamidopyrimidine glycosylase family protein n=1 Tax=Georgenia sp. TF02-10 TaxID=2917725 RepID=UPI001FA75012|nr:DNA-formamidopyrimidine glycosylase family protein [Georgenia sp. TF02-10]UNX55915.1 Fpg/Nei family DNA glycosylase [Georgenia sp. TF02-10]
MPEMPEVEGLAQFLRERAVGRAVSAVEVGAVSALKTFSPAPTALAGRRVTDVARHGKWLDLVTGPGQPAGGAAAGDEPGPAGDEPGPPGDDEPEPAELHLLVHLAKAGWLRWYDAVPATALRPGRSPIALRVRLDDGAGFDLTEAGTRKRLAVHVVARPADVPAVATLGVEPADLTLERLRALLAARNQQVKGLLRDQSVIAGIGNAYSDEILHAARMSPFALTRTFDDDASARLHTAIGEVLRAAVAAAAGRPAADLKDAKRRGMRVHGRTGQPCPVCGDTVREVSFADSALQYCPTCQTEGKVLADRRMSRLLR